MFPNPSSGPTADSPVDRAEALLIACGFALGFGWLWFPFLAAHWLPAFLWGRPFAGGGASLFLALMTGGLLLYRFFAGPKAARPSPGPEPTDLSAPPLGLGPHQAHAAALLTGGLEISSYLLAWEIPASFRVAALALAGLAMGLFWGGRLLSLPPAQAGWALIAAGLAGLLLALGLGRCPLSSPGLCLSLPLALAWLAAWRLGRLKTSRPDRKRPRGRPPKKSGPTESRAGAARPLTKIDWSLIGAALLLMGLNEFGPGHSFPAWLGQVMAVAGATATMFLFHRAAEDKAGSSGLWELDPDRPQILLCSALALLGAGQMLAPGLFFLPAKFLMGVICLILTRLLAGTPPRAAAGRAAVALALALIASNIGTETAAWLSGLLTETSGPPLVSAPAARLAGLITLLAALAGRALAVRTEAGRLAEAEAGPGSPGPAGLSRPARTGGDQAESPGDPGPARPAAEAIEPILTSREEEIMGLAARGCGNRQIADRLNIQEATVRFHLRNIYKKTGLKNRRGLPALASRLERERKMA